VKKAYVYIITCHENGKQYVGVTVNPTTRWGAHIYGAFADGRTKFARAIRKYGKDAFEFKLIIGFLTQDDAYEFEIQLIHELDTVKNGYNSNYGGMGGVCPSEEVRKKIADAMRGRVPSDETRKKISDACLRRRDILAKNASERFRGKTLTEEHKRKLSEAGKGKHSDRVFSEETRYKMGSTNRGKCLSAEHRRKISEAGKGRKHSAETRAKMRRKETPEQCEQRRQSALARWERIRNERNIKDVEISTDSASGGQQVPER